MIEFCISFFIEKYSKFIDSIRSGNFIDTFCQKYWQITKKSSPHPLHGILLLWLYFTLPYFFFLGWSPSLYLCMVFDSISSNIGEVLSINPSVNVVFTPCKAEQLLRGMELQEKHKKDYRIHFCICLERTYS